MSVQDVHTFFARLGEDKALMEKVRKAGEDSKENFKPGEESSEDTLNTTFALIEPIARDEGLSFTLSDLKAAVDEGLKLSEEDLDNLTGAGTKCVIIGTEIGHLICVIIGSTCPGCVCIISGEGTYKPS